MFSAAPLSDELPHLGNDDIVGTAAVRRHPERVVHLAPAVQAKNEVVHLAVDEFVLLIVKRHAVGGDGEMYLLAELRFKLTPIGHDALHDIEVHQRFAAEQIHLEMAAVSAMLYQKIKRALSGFCAHQHPAAVEFSGFGKAVSAAQVAVMRHVEAHALYR